VPIYRLHDTTGDDLGVIEDPAPNVEPGDMVVLADGREALVTARVEAELGPGPLVAVLEVAIARLGLKQTTRSRSRQTSGRAGEIPARGALRIEERELEAGGLPSSLELGKVHGSATGMSVSTSPESCHEYRPVQDRLRGG
jgi:hypothetical protein